MVMIPKGARKRELCWRGPAEIYWPGRCRQRENKPLNTELEESTMLAAVTRQLPEKRTEDLVRTIVTFKVRQLVISL
jgi:hypothetical protein